MYNNAYSLCPDVNSVGAFLFANYTTLNGIIMTDFSIYQDTEKPILGGMCEKAEIQIGGTRYIIKYQSITDLGPIYNHVSEYLGSHVFDLLGVPVQDTMLGTYKGKNVVLIKNFCGPGEKLITYNHLGESIIEKHPEMFENAQEVIERYWDMFIIDALNGNSDRHGGNWGFIEKANKLYPAPVFDNDCCMYPTINDDKQIIEILCSASGSANAVISPSVSQIKHNGRRLSYFDVINSKSYYECNKAVERICNNFNIRKIFRLINDIPNISAERKLFYKKMYRLNLYNILK